jgi:hypothetical protein
VAPKIPATSQPAFTPTHHRLQTTSHPAFTSTHHGFQTTSHPAFTSTHHRFQTTSHPARFLAPTDQRAAVVGGFDEVAGGWRWSRQSQRSESGKMAWPWRLL